MKNYSFYAACPKGLEGLLFEELKALDVESPRETIGGVHFSGDLATAYRSCLWSRLANKILLPLATIEFTTDQDIYDAVIEIPWEDHLDQNGAFKIDFIGTNDVIRNSQFGAVRIKDGIVDRFRQRMDCRPSVRKDMPDLIFNARLAKNKVGKDSVHISIDLAGQSLHRRGYRTKQGMAPLKENLAAALLMRAQWPLISQQSDCGLIDPMCGSATLLIEGMLMAADIAPGLSRREWGFTHWRKFDESDWQPLIDDALLRKKIGLEKLRERGIECRGYDQDWQVLHAAESNIALAGLHEFIRVSRKSIDEFKQPTHKEITTGLVICNPPYGERLGDEQALLPVYRQLGTALKEEFSGWKAGIFTANVRLAKNMGIRARKVYKFFNGTLATDLVCFDLDEASFVKQATLDKSDAALEGNETLDDKDDTSPQTFEALSNGAQMVCNRLKKNQKQLRKWLNKSEVECYRLYDADMPEYSAAIDCYGSWIHVQEYKAPKTIDEKKAEYRFDELLSAIPIALNISKANIFVKQRQRNKGKQQYERFEEQENRAKIAVQEGQATLLVDLWSYLDSGLFLDHRPVRQRITTMVNGKDFLNLFCYTATATVHAALAGAKSSVSVDMSNTYIDWAEENFDANNISTERHELVQGDCIKWLEDCRQGFDVILLDPPSFSNSKRMDDVFDVQRDHAQMIHRCMDLLNHGGTLIFSNNLRTFKLDKDITDEYRVDNITDQTFDPDFQRNKRIHQCYLIQS